MARTQTLVQLSDDLVAALDEVAASSGQSRSQLIRAAIRAYLTERIERTVDERIVEAYTRLPQEDDAWAQLAAEAMIREEPW